VTPPFFPSHTQQLYSRCLSFSLGYVYQIKNTINDKEKLGGKIPEDDKTAIEDALKETIEWLDENVDEDKEVYDEKYKELEEIVNPVFAKLYQSGAAHPPGMDEEMPSHDEL